MEFVVLVVIVLVGVAVTGVVRIRRRRVAASASDEPEPSRRLRSRLEKSRRAIAERLGTFVGRGRLDPQFWQDVEDVLVGGDVGVETARHLVESVRAAHPDTPAAARSLLIDEITALLAGRRRELSLDREPGVILVVGVNGGGKTTTIAKLAALLQRAGTAVLLGAADTYRAAADTQLRTWAGRVGVDIVAAQAGADPASVAYDAYAAARARGAGAVIIDTAGRLQSKKNLMDELTKVARVLRREAGELDEVLLVIDGTTGQNAISQARRFAEAVGVTGIVITKLDGTARGGVAIAIERELDIPVKFIGVGEGVDDLIPFEPHEFVDALVGP